MPEQVYHRRTAAYPSEKGNVLKSGVLWGKSAATIAGSGPECVKAFAGPLPTGEVGYTFHTDVLPTRKRRFWGTDGFVWEEGTDGVSDVPDKPGFVQISVRIVNG